MHMKFRLLAVALVIAAVILGRHFASWDKVLLITVSWTIFLVLLFKVSRGRGKGDS